MNEKIEGKVAIKTSPIYYLSTFHKRNSKEENIVFDQKSPPKNMFSMHVGSSETQKTTFQGMLMLVGPYTLFVIRHSQKNKGPFLQLRVSDIPFGATK